MSKHVSAESILPIFRAATMSIPISGSIDIDGCQVNWFTSFNTYLRIQFPDFQIMVTSILGRQYFDCKKIISHLEMSVFITNECFNKWKQDPTVFNAEYQNMMDQLLIFFTSVSEFNYDGDEVLGLRRTDFDSLVYGANKIQFRDQVNAIDIQTGIIQPYREDPENRSLL